jgi:hypothetical protein
LRSFDIVVAGVELAAVQKRPIGRKKYSVEPGAGGLGRQRSLSTMILPEQRRQGEFPGNKKADEW